MQLLLYSLLGTAFRCCVFRCVPLCTVIPYSLFDPVFPIRYCVFPIRYCMLCCVLCVAVLCCVCYCKVLTELYLLHTPCLRPPITLYFAYNWNYVQCFVKQITNLFNARHTADPHSFAAGSRSKKNGKDQKKGVHKGGWGSAGLRLVHIQNLK